MDIARLDEVVRLDQTLRGQLKEQSFVGLNRPDSFGDIRVLLHYVNGAHLTTVDVNSSDPECVAIRALLKSLCERRVAETKAKLRQLGVPTA